MFKRLMTWFKGFIGLETLTEEEKRMYHVWIHHTEKESDERRGQVL
jgi:hypothetical protein